MIKTISIIAIALTLNSCENADVKGRPVIFAKFYTEKDCVCRYHYNGLGTRYQSFEDSCNKYSVADTIK